MLGFTPSRVHRSNSSTLVIGGDGNLAVLDREKNIGKQYLTSIDSISLSALAEDVLIVSSQPQAPSLGSKIGLIEIQPETPSIAGEIPELSTGSILPFSWDRVLEGTLEALCSEGSNFIFVLHRLGIYSMEITGTKGEIKVNEKWRSPYPTWKNAMGSGISDRVATMCFSHHGFNVLSEGGEWLRLSSENGEILSQGTLKVRDPVYRASDLGDHGIMIMTRGSHAVIVDHDFNSKHDFTGLPGPVLDVLVNEGIVRWTGWRHDGEFLTEGGEFTLHNRREIGVGMINDNWCVCNDGKVVSWGPYSSESEAV